jgi:hypothetical protein
VEEHLRKVVASHQRDWDMRSPLFLLAYRASTHETTGLTQACLVFGGELRIYRDLLFEATPDKERPTTDHAVELVNHLHDIHDYSRRHLKLASDRMKIRHDKLANCAGYHEGDWVGLYRPARKKKKSPRLQSSWDGPYKKITQKTPRSRMMLVHLDRLATIIGLLETSVRRMITAEWYNC